MIQQPSNWIRVTKADPCPICGKPDWCMVADDGKAAICPRTPEGCVKLIDGSGYLHRIGNDVPPFRRRPRPAPRKKQRPAAPISWSKLQIQHASRRRGLDELARQLELSEQSLIRLGIGTWKPGIWTFPMRDGAGNVIGMRTRDMRTGEKKAIKGSRSGLFIPHEPSNSTTLIVCEGPTDTAAVLDLGFNAIGKPSCNSGDDFVAERVHGLDVVIMADQDGPGWDGAEKLAGKIKWRANSVKIIAPHRGKDVREWKPSAGLLLGVIKNAGRVR